MILVGGGINKNQANHAGDEAARPRRGARFQGVKQGAAEQEREDGVFRKMRAFAEKMMNRLDLGVWHMGKEPMQERHHNTEGVLGGMAVGGGGKNQYHPEEGWEPVPDKIPKFGHVK